MNYNNLKRVISDATPQMHSITGCDKASCKLNVGNVHVFKKVCEDLSNFTLIKMLGSHITMTEEIVQKAKAIVQTIMFNKTLNENYISTTAR